MLATLPLEELDYGHAREHATSCRDCERIGRVVIERERNLRLAFDTLQSSISPVQVAIEAIEASRRRRVARYYQVALSFAMVACLVYFVMLRRVPVTVPQAVGTISETFRLQCLSPEQAAVVLGPYVAPTGSISLSPGTLGIITVQASPEVMQKARSALDRYDNPARSQCAVQVTVPKTP